MTLPSFLKITQKKKTFNKEDSAYIERDWTRALLIFFVVAVVFVVFGVFVFRGVNTDELFVFGVGEENTLIDEELLNATLNSYAEKLKRFERFQTSPPNVPVI